MKLTITGTGIESKEWPGVEYTIQAETESFKTTVQFWETVDTFKEFGKALLKFPFEDKGDITYRVRNYNDSGNTIALTVTLADPVGKTALMVETNAGGNNLSFSGEIEVVNLDKLAKAIRKADFTQPAEISWESRADL